MTGDRPEYGTVKMRAADLLPGDVTHNKHGRWAEVTEIVTAGNDLYVLVRFDSGGELEIRNVHLATVQKPKPQK